MKTIAIDGPSGAGKSAIASALAKRLGYEYIDTGALYRTIAYIAVREGGDLSTKELLKRVDAQSIDYKDGAVQLNGEALGDVIRTEAISQKTSQLSKEPAVRDYLLSLQRRLAEDGGVVMEGRDIGTVVLPSADVKFFLTASEEERARRRYEQRLAFGEAVDMETIKADIHARDERDKNRAVAPLKQAADAILVDSTAMSEEEVLDTMVNYVENGHVL
ncbi:(d)CMP kinase [Aedoeadaptatus acetigenes]|uniref:Cytidylate kinase n=1 Tax=Aedoeadaptatus acetigenes TaxID=2981723 RepID=A0ABV1J3D8_9FIRM|nr:(d)CMP kinase [Aedoeadaptatus acetigenes]MCU6785653.1 (d)CMP kinase [Aedoeadaptatus acetigenes]